MSADGGDRRDATSDGNRGIPRIIVASGILLYREGLAASLARDGRLEVVAITDLSEAASAAAQLIPDAVVLDASTSDGLELARNLKSADSALPLIGFGISDSPADVIGCAEAGLVGFIDQNGSIDALVKAVANALRGEVSCSPRVTTILCARLARLADRGTHPPTTLTRREQEIAGMVAEGMSNKEIALGLHIGPTTVKNHVHNILDKLKVRRRAAIASHVAQSAN